MARAPQLTNVGAIGVGVVNRGANGEAHPASLCLGGNCMPWIVDLKDAGSGFFGMAVAS
jgi:hypothetical protein